MIHPEERYLINAIADLATVEEHFRRNEPPFKSTTLARLRDRLRERVTIEEQQVHDLYRRFDNAKNEQKGPYR